LDRRTFVGTLAGGLLAGPLAAGAQPPGRIWRIGYLSLVSERLVQYRPWVAAFRDGLRRLGYVEGENVTIEQRYAAGQVERLPALTAELVRLRADVLVAAPAGSALAAKKVTSTIPIVFMGEPDPVGTGLVASLARPGGNATGLADAHTELLPKRLELLKLLVPTLSRVGVLWNPSNASTAPQLKAVQAAGPALGLTIVPVGSRGRRTMIWTGPSRRSDVIASAGFSWSATRSSGTGAPGSPSSRSRTGSRRPARTGDGPRAVC